MGTNVYMMKIPTVDLKLELEYLKEKKKELDVEENICILTLMDIFEISENAIHIGKRSAGWKFLFQSNPQYYKPTKESIDEFLRNEDYVIYDEYFDIITPDEFWEDYYSDVGYDGKTYHEKYKDETYFPNFEYTTEEGLRFSDGEFS